jgi:DNA-binding NarL/FixJ family response regulator
MSFASNLRSNRLLIITDRPTTEDAWCECVAQLSLVFAAVDVANCQAALDRLSTHDYSVVIMDAALCQDTTALVTAVRSAKPRGLTILIVDRCPSWSQARAFFRAGASDYVSADSSPQDLMLQYREALLA